MSIPDFSALPRAQMKDPQLKVVAGVAKVRGFVSGHPEVPDGHYYETTALVAIDFANQIAFTKGVAYEFKGETLK